jgi:hypothetical protein
MTAGGMRSYVVTSGTVFGLIVLAHIARAVAEGLVTLSDPWFVGSSIVAAGLAAWAVRLLRVPS